MKFAVPRIWREPKNHYDDCCFCLINVASFKVKKSSSLDYPDIPSSIAFAPHSEEHPIPIPSCEDDDESSSTSSSVSSGEKPNVENFKLERLPHYPNQQELNDLTRDLGLTKSNAELLTSHLMQWNPLDASCQISVHRKHDLTFSKHFAHKNNPCYRIDVQGLFRAIGIPCVSNEWRLFIDSSSRLLKAILLQNGSKLPSIPIAHSMYYKEVYDNVQLLLDAVKYYTIEWELVGDFKMVTFLRGLQRGFAKCPCCLCLWDSRDTAS